MRTRLTLILIVLSAATLLAVAPAAAFEVAAFTEGPTESEPAEQDPGSELGIVPAVEAPVEGAEESDAPWTQRFLAPLVLLLGVLGLVASIAYYGLRIRGKYRVAS